MRLDELANLVRNFEPEFRLIGNLEGGELLEIIEGAAMLQEALERSPYDVSPCGECGEATVCLPDGLPMCEACGRAAEGKPATPELLPAKELEHLVAKCRERAGMVNAYVCEDCGVESICVLLDTGTTPFVARCPACGLGRAQSRRYGPRQPAFVWFRPRSLAEVEEVSALDLQLLKRRPATESPGMTLRQVIELNVQHVNKGGLLRRPLEERRRHG